MQQRAVEVSDSESGTSAPSDYTQSRDTSTASKRYVSAPFLLQGQLGRRGAPVSELVVVDTPPSHRTNPTLQTVSPPLQLRNQQAAMMLSPIEAVNPQQRQHPQQRPARLSGPSANPVTLPQTLMVRNLREGSSDSTATTTTTAVMTSNEYTPLTNASSPSMPYTWTDSYLDESPEATRARWMQRQTFGPVLQSEGGASSTIASTPHVAKQDAEAIWGGVLARNDRERAAQEKGQNASTGGFGAKDSIQDAYAGGNNYHGNNTRAGGAGQHPRRYNLEAAERGGDGLGRGTQQQRKCVDGATGETYRNGLSGMPGNSTAAKALFPDSAGSYLNDGVLVNNNNTTNDSCGANAKHLLSDVSTVIATVQQPRRIVQVTPVDRSPLPQPQRTSPQPQKRVDFQISPTTTTTNTTATGATPTTTSSTKRHSGPTQISSTGDVYLSTSATLLPSALPPNAPELRGSRDVVVDRTSRSPALSVRDGVRSSGRHHSSRSSSTGENSSSDVGESSTSDVLKGSSSGNGRASRNGPIRRRVLKPIYDD